MTPSASPDRITNRRRLHRLLQAQIELASPEATRLLAAALERVALHLAVHSAKAARADGRITIKRIDLEKAWNDFIDPRQAVTWTANELRGLIDRLETRASDTASNLVSEAAPQLTRKKGRSR